MRIDTDNLCDVKYVAWHFEVSESAVHNWLSRYEGLAERVTIEWKGNSQLFDWREWEDWGAETGRLYEPTEGEEVA